MNMGAGRIVHMDITRIDLLIANKQWQSVPLFQQAMERERARQLHFLGLLSDGGVHSHIQDLFALLEMAKQHKVEKVFVHCFMDGRDTPPNSGRDYVRRLQQKMRELGVGEIATLVGRYYAMDRDNRWERVELAYRALVHGEAETRTDDPVGALQRSYEANVTDEFVKPIVVTKASGRGATRVGLVRDDEGVVFFSFSGDRGGKGIEKGDFDAIIMNYANADMVGHSGKLEAAIKAVEAVDAGLTRIYQALRPRGGVWMITADHGNAETMIDPATGGPHTYHTT